MKSFTCHDIIPGCDQVIIGDDDRDVLDQVIAHAAAAHGLIGPPAALVELVLATTHSVAVHPAGLRGPARLRLVPELREPDPSSGEVPAGPPAPWAPRPAVRSGRIGGSSGAMGGPVRQRGNRAANLPSQPDGSSTGGSSTGGSSTGDSRTGDSRTGDSRTGDSRTGGSRTGRGTGDQVTGHRSASRRAENTEQHNSYRHECLFYAGTGGFLDAVVPFIQDGLALDQPVMVAVAQPRLEALRAALGADARHVAFQDMAALGHNPASIIPAWRQFAGDRPTRGVGEPIWAGRRQEEIAEAQLHESLLQSALDPATPLWLVCPYDVAALDQSMIAEAHRSHPGAESAADADRHAMALFVTDLPIPPVSATELIADDPDEVAAQVLRRAVAAGLPAQRSVRLATALDEVARAGAAASGADARVRIWQDGPALVCQVQDAGVVTDPMLGRRATVGSDHREAGVRMANDLCDLVQVRSGSSGTTVRVHTWL